jgi:CheY-like chemotaxis protein
VKVLVVEDSLTNREVVCGLLGQQGHEGIAVESGEEALAAFDAHRFDLVLMDVELPGMSGPDAAAAIRKKNTRIPILAMTGHTSDEQRERCLAAGMNDFLSKPIRPASLLGCVCRSTALEKLAGNQGLRDRVVAAFCKEATDLLQGIRAAIAGNDARTLYRCAHTLHGSIRYFGAERAIACAQKLQAMGEANALDGASDALAALEAECERLQSALSKA